jgi:hypothetical protein
MIVGGKMWEWEMGCLDFTLMFTTGTFLAFDTGMICMLLPGGLLFNDGSQFITKCLMTSL